MIIDKIANLDLYQNINKNFDKAFEFLKREDIYELVAGAYTIDGEDVCATVVNRELSDDFIKEWEGHRKYIDIQCILDGREVIGYVPLDEVKENAISEYSEQKDCILFKNLDGINIELSKGWFMVLFPQDVHCPNCKSKLESYSKKIIIKVKM